jgi:uncharacterized protein
METLTWDALGLVVGVALVAGFVTGFAGFGTALVAAGLWLHVLPAAVVPPLVAVCAAAGQMVGVVHVRRVFRWDRAWPYLAGAAFGVPLGVMALDRVSPEILLIVVGVFLILYTLAQVTGLGRLRIGSWGGRKADGLVGLGGGALGGFAGLSGPLPLIWLQLRGGSSEAQRATYQPFNLVVLTAASLGMAIAGRIDGQVLVFLALCLPATVAGAWLGVRSYRLVDEAMFRAVVLGLLCVSGIALLIRTFV